MLGKEGFRMGFGTRKPTSNELPHVEENRWLKTNDCMDEVALLLNDMAKRCISCRRAISNEYLVDGKCPDCRPGDTRMGPEPAKPVNYGASSDGPGECE
jgi:hypothetical protein